MTRVAYIGLSGGVDSAVAASKLIEAGFDVRGVFIESWQVPGIPCTQEQDRIDAMRVAAHLQIPFERFDARDAYYHHVVRYLIDEYQRGRTPNPDIFCNRDIKFGVFYHYARSQGADVIATGHYARVERREDNEYALCLSADEQKDQTYFLWTLSQQILAHVVFPIGTETKAMVRQYAQDHNLPIATKKDSQGICMLGALSLREFLTSVLPLTPGDVLDAEGNVIGEHDGAILYTIGQRHGFRVAVHAQETPRQYVIAKNIVQNTITVCKDAPGLSSSRKNTSVVTLRDVHWIRRVPTEGEHCRVRVRHRAPFVPAIIRLLTSSSLTIETQLAVLAVPGQSLVMYVDNECIGGGIVDDTRQEIQEAVRTDGQ